MWVPNSTHNTRSFRSNLVIYDQYDLGLCSTTWGKHNMLNLKATLESTKPVLVIKSCPTLCNPRLLCPWDSPGKNTGVSSYSLLQGIFPSQESNPDLLHCRQILYHLSHQESTQIGSSAPIFISYFSIFILSPFS